MDHTLNGSDKPGHRPGRRRGQSYQFTVNSAILQIVKQVWDAGGNCLASSTPVGGCLNNPVTVPAGTVVNFLIYVDNSTSVQVTDARIRDVLDDLAAGFNYVAGSLKWNNNTTATGAAINTIYADAAVNALLDPVDADIASALDTGGTAGQVDNITIGAVAGQANAQLNITASRVFALRFQAIKK
jgi:hypothetical protein